MKILALEFSSAVRSVALAADRKVLATAGENAPQSGGPLRLVRTVCQEAGVSAEEIDCIAVGLGPGSYTGVRVAIALAQGWQLARGIRLLGISSIEVMAQQAQDRRWFGGLSLVVDAQRGEYYLARYEIAERRTEETAKLRLARREEIIERIAAGDRVAGPDPVPGTAAVLSLVPEAGTLARLTAGRTDFVRGDELEPVYLREVNYVKAPPLRAIQPVEGGRGHLANGI